MGVSADHMVKAFLIDSVFSEGTSKAILGDQSMPLDALRSFIVEPAEQTLCWFRLEFGPGLGRRGPREVR